LTISAIASNSFSFAPPFFFRLFELVGSHGRSELALALDSANGIDVLYPGNIHNFTWRWRKEQSAPH
jgi:hypothetical protein